MRTSIPKQNTYKDVCCFTDSQVTFYHEERLCTHTDIENLFSAVCTHTATFHVSFFCNLSIEAIMYYTEMPLLMSE